MQKSPLAQKSPSVSAAEDAAVVTLGAHRDAGTNVVDTDMGANTDEGEGEIEAESAGEVGSAGECGLD